MYSLWIKIFIWFWLAMVAVGAALVVVVTLTRPELPEAFDQGAGLSRDWRELARSAFGEQARRTVRVLNTQGEAGLEAELRRQRREFGIRSAVFDRTGREISGLDVPAGARQLARSSQRRGQAEMRSLAGGRLLIAVPVRAAGARYVIVGELPRPFGISTSPASFLLRAATVLLTGGLVCYLLSRHLTSPLAALQKATRRLAEGELQWRAGDGPLGRRGDEFGALAQDFDRMAERIESLVVRQRQLLGDISHELRSPLARLSVALGIAQDQASEESRGALNRIEAEVEALDELIGQLLQLSRLEQEAGPGEEDVRLDTLLHEIVDDAAFEGSVSGRRVVLSEAPACRVTGSARLLRSALENVIRNALAFTPEGSDVAVHLEKSDGSGARVIVRDAGPGVDNKLLESIFEPFVRADGARDVRQGGVGLGLAISRRIVQLHGGTMTARNRPEGGLEVEVSLPASSA